MPAALIREFLVRPGLAIVDRRLRKVLSGARLSLAAPKVFPEFRSEPVSARLSFSAISAR